MPHPLLMQARALWYMFLTAQRALQSWLFLTALIGSGLIQALQSQPRKGSVMSRFTTASAEELARRGLNSDGTPIKVEKVRARKKNGTLKADDPSTPNVNEAWEDKPAKKKG